MTAPNLPALRQAHSDDLDFDGDTTILGLLREKLFRLAIHADHKLPDMPDDLFTDLDAEIANLLRAMDTAASWKP